MVRASARPHLTPFRARWSLVAHKWTGTLRCPGCSKPRGIWSISGDGEVSAVLSAPVTHLSGKCRQPLQSYGPSLALAGRPWIGEGRIEPGGHSLRDALLDMKPTAPPLGLNSTLSIARTGGQGQAVGRRVFTADASAFATAPHAFSPSGRAPKILYWAFPTTCARLVVGQVRAPFLTPSPYDSISHLGKVCFCAKWWLFTSFLC